MILQEEERQARVAEVLQRARRRQAKANVTRATAARLSQLSLMLDRLRLEQAAVASVAPERARHLADAIADLELMIRRELESE